MIYGKVGRIGHGKTMAAVVESIELARRRKAVLVSNIRLRPPDAYGLEVVQLPMDGFSDALSTIIDQSRTCGSCTTLDQWWDQVAHTDPGCERRGLVVLIDEVDTIWDAKEWQDMSKMDRFTIKQSRKLGADLFWTAQFVDQVEKSLRNITEEVELMRAFPNPTIRRREKGARPWLFIGQAFRPGAIRELTQKIDPDARLGRRMRRYRRQHERWFNTDDLVIPVDRKRRQEAASPGRRWQFGQSAQEFFSPPKS